MNEEYAIKIDNLTKTFNKQIAVDHISFNIKRGEIFALLGPNGAGKTTTLRMITTLLKPTSGSVKILGHDVRTETKIVRSLFGLTGQYASIDEDLSAHENLMIFSRLNGLSISESKKRSDELLEKFSLTKSADKAISNFSGGMRRRLDLAVSLIARPKIIFLDEPTTGLDPRTRMQMWNTIRQLVSAGSTIILTTQYLEEADNLADHIAIIDHGKLVKFGTPCELKEKIGNKKLLLTFQDSMKTNQAKQIIKSNLTEKIQQNGNAISINLQTTDDILVILNYLTAEKIKVLDIEVEQPSLDDVFFEMTVGKN